MKMRNLCHLYTGLIVITLCRYVLSLTSVFPLRQSHPKLKKIQITKPCAASKSYELSCCHSKAVDDDDFNNKLDNSTTLNVMVYDTLMRYELKKEILECAKTFEMMQKEIHKMKDIEAKVEKTTRLLICRKRDFLIRIFRKLQSRRQADITKMGDEMLLELQKEKMRGLFGSDSFGIAVLALKEKVEEVIQLAERLSYFNPTPIPTYGWKGYRGGNPKKDCLLDGSWKLQFATHTDYADIIPEKNAKLEKSTTSQVLDASVGTLTNVVDFGEGNVEGIRVIVKGEVDSDTDVTLTLDKIIIQRRKKLLYLFKTITIPSFSLNFLRGLKRIKSRGSLKFMYIDEDFRIHRTSDGRWFIQTRF